MIAVCVDAQTSNTVKEAKKILGQSGANYNNVVLASNFEAVIPTKYFPTAFIVDSFGRIIIDPIYGAQPGIYEAAISSALSAA